MKNSTKKFGKALSKYDIHEQTSHSTHDNIVDTTVALTTQEIENLVFMYQEEKLAMDVYNYFYEMYDVKIFDKIADSELNHLTAVGNILEAYNIDMTNLISLEAGNFDDTSLQAVYNQLIEEGSISLENALNVGVAIEILDMEDLSSQLQNEYLNDNIVNVYEKLEAGSENHLAAFEKALGDDLFIA